MNLRYAFFLFFILTAGFAKPLAAQPVTVRGSVGDTLNNSRLYRASISLIRTKDSILQAFTHADSAGNFRLTVPKGRYFLLIAYPGFADYIDQKDLNEDATLPVIPLVSRTHVLQEFVLKKKAAAIVIKGDTTEYAADSFGVANGASVEELLKKLPGLQVDKDGNVTAQGEKVQKILVDGEEFFSDDPAVVTKNLQAATVDKVQVFDKKSDQAAFTGIDDGEKTKTINLTLKEDKKKGVFGKAVAGGGPSLSSDQKNHFFENQAMVNAFRGKQQISGFGIMSNTGTTGLGWGDQSKYGAGSDGVTREYDEASGMMYSYYESNDDDLSGGWNGRYSGEGLPSVWTGGLHYANKWSKDAQHLSANYRYARFNIEAEGTNTTQYILPDSGYVRKSGRNTFSTAQRHGGDGLYEWTIDTSSNLKLVVGGNYVDRTNSGTYLAETRGASGGLINLSNRLTSTTSSSQNFNATLIYRKKFRKQGRNVSAELRANTRNSDGVGYVTSGNQYYTDGHLSGGDSVNQRKTSKAENMSMNLRLSYTEPLSKESFLTLRYGANVNNSISERLSFNRAGNGEWSGMPVDSFSSSFGYDVLTQNAALTWRVVKKKYNFSLGGEVFNTAWQQRDRLYQLANRDRNFNNFAPTANFRYSFSKQSNINVNYSGRTSQPTLEQLQPLRQNTDPLNVSLGNPDLRQEFRNNFGLNYHSYKPLSNRYAYVSASGGFTQDDITRAEFFDAQGRHTYQYINVNGNWNGYFYGGYNFKVKRLDLNLGVNSNFSVSRNNTIINGQKNVSQNNQYSIGFNVNRYWKKNDKDVFSFELNPDITYVDNKSNISLATQSYWTAQLNAEIFAQLPYKVQLRSELWYDYRQRTQIFTANNNVVRWNASLGRKFLKGDKLELRATVADILNQNLGYSRDAQANYISEDRYNTIRRNLMFSVVYLFSGGAGVAKNDDDDD